MCVVVVMRVVVVMCVVVVIVGIGRCIGNSGQYDDRFCRELMNLMSNYSNNTYGRYHFML